METIKNSTETVKGLKTNSRPTERDINRAKKFIAEYIPEKEEIKTKPKRKKLRRAYKKSNTNTPNSLRSAADLLKHVKKTVLHWENKRTGHIISYQRAYALGLTEDPTAHVGILNPKTHKLVRYQRAKKLGLLKNRMLIKQHSKVAA